MRMPFQRLMELAAAAMLDPATENKSLGDLAREWQQPVDRVMDAIDAVRVLNGEQTYISLPPGSEN